MNKEEILEALKSLVDELVNHEDELTASENKKLEWERKRRDCMAAITNRNSCDMLWISDEFDKWFKDNIKIPSGLERQLDDSMFNINPK